MTRRIRPVPPSKRKAAEVQPHDERDAEVLRRYDRRLDEQIATYLDHLANAGDAAQFQDVAGNLLQQLWR
jgi:hypothetical protein